MWESAICVLLNKSLVSYQSLLTVLYILFIREVYRDGRL